MNPKNAIKIIQENVDDPDIEWDSPLGEAYKLSFEALKQILAARTITTHCIPSILPGETEN